MKFTIKTLLGVTAVIACFMAGAEFIRTVEYSYHKILVELLSIFMIGLMVVAIADAASGRKSPYWVAFLLAFFIFAILSRLVFSDIVQLIIWRPIRLMNYYMTQLPANHSIENSQRTGALFQFAELFSLLVFAHLTGVSTRYFCCRDKRAIENS